MTQVHIQQSRERILELIELAVCGEEVIIFQDKRPLIKLAPIVAQTKQRQFGSAKGMITRAEDFDDSFLS